MKKKQKKVVKKVLNFCGYCKCLIVPDLVVEHFKDGKHSHYECRHCLSTKWYLKKK